MSKRIANFPPDFDFSTLARLEASTGIRFSGEGPELQGQNAAVTAQPSPLNSADGSIVLDEAVSPLLQLINIVPGIVENIANRLDPQSFLNLACSCTQLYNFFSRPTARTHIDIPLKQEKLIIRGVDGSVFITYTSELVPSPMGIVGEYFEKCVQLIRKWPFSVHFDTISFEEDCDDEAIPETRRILDRLGAVSVRKLSSKSELACADLIGLIDSYGVRVVDLLEIASMYNDPECSALVQKPLDALLVRQLSARLLHLSSIPTITVDFDDVNQAELKSIVHKWLVADNLVDWKLFTSMNFSDFIAAFSEFSFLSFDYVGALPAHRPWLFFTGSGNRNEEGLAMFIFRDDGKLMKISISRLSSPNHNQLRLTFCPIAAGPPVLSLQ